MSALSAADRMKLAKVLGLLGSDHGGERAAAGLLATRIISAAGVDWTALLQVPCRCAGVQPPNSPMSTMSDIGVCVRNLRQLNRWEQDFVLNLRGRSTFTAGQRRKLGQIAAELRMAGAA